jgi:hypothetical protein
MAAPRPTAVIVQKRAEVILAGMNWHPVLSTDIRERESLVDEFVQANGIDLISVIESGGGLQVGYCERGRLPLTEGRIRRWLSFAVLVKLHFRVESIVLVWKVDKPDGGACYAVLIFEEGALLLDRVVEASAVEDVVTTYLENTGELEPGQRLTNDPQLFPEFLDISALDWMDQVSDAARLRPPRPARLIDMKKRPLQGASVMLGLIGASLALTWYVWVSFIDKPRIVPAKPKADPIASYSRLVAEKSGSLGFASDGLRDLIIELMTLPLRHEDWQLESVICSQKDCVQSWVGLPGADARDMSTFGALDKKKKNEAPSNTLKLRKPHGVATSGFLSKEKLRSRHEANLFCQREAMTLQLMKLKARFQCNGVPWPEKAVGVPADMMINRYNVKVTSDWVTLDRLLDRYADSVYWNELKLRVVPGNKHLLEILEFEFSGDLYGYQ